MFIRIAERYAAGHLQANDLQRERDAQMIVREIPAPSRDKTFAVNQMPNSSQQKRKQENSCMDFDQTCSMIEKRVSLRIKPPQHQKDVLNDCHARHEYRPANTMVLFFSRRHRQRDTNKEIAFFRSHLFVKQN